VVCQGIRRAAATDECIGVQQPLGQAESRYGTLTEIRKQPPAEHDPQRSW
jgi:hypothetical protein